MTPKTLLPPRPASLPIGDLEPRKQLREKLQCKDNTENGLTRCHGLHAEHLDINLYMSGWSKKGPMNA